MTSRHGINPPIDKFEEYLSKVKEDINTDARQKLESGRDVIFDFGFWKRKERDVFRDQAKNWGHPYKMIWVKAADHIMEERVLTRTAQLPAGQLVIDKNAIAEFRKRFEPLQEDEDYIIVES